MTPTKLLIGQILGVLAIILFGVWTATQWAAEMLAHQPELGTPWFLLGHLPVYRPWSLFPWWFHYDAYAPMSSPRRAPSPGRAAFWAAAPRSRYPYGAHANRARYTTYGSARWASEAEIRRAGLRSDAGLFLGSLRWVGPSP